MRAKIVDGIRCFLQYRGLKKLYTSSTLACFRRNLPTPTRKEAVFFYDFGAFGTRRISREPSSNFACFSALRYLNAASFSTLEASPDTVDAFDDSNGEVEPIDSWEEEDESVPEVGDGGDGGGVVLNNCPWGENVLTIARKVLLQFDEDLELFAFKTSARGYIYVRLDKLSHQYGCPSMTTVESFSRKYKSNLDELGRTGEIPVDLALEVSSPGADRLLRVPDDLSRFRNVPMVVNFSENSNASCQEKSGVFFLDHIETESSCCVWKLADVRENRDASAKGRPLSRKQREWRLKLEYHMIKLVTLYIHH